MSHDGEKELQKEAKRWQELAREKGISQAADYYWKRVFPLVREKFKTENSHLAGSYGGLILTLGTTPQPIILTLEAIEPRKVYFLYTKETEKHMLKIVEEVSFLREHSVPYDRDLVDPGNPLELYEKIGRKWAEWYREGSFRCAVCNTGGKKSMVSAAAAAANFLGIDIIYVDHESYLEDLRVPEPGAERLTVLPNPLVAMGELKLKEARSLFNAGNHETARRVLDEVRQELGGREALPVGMTVEVLSILVEGYMLWDLFHYGNAREKLKKGYDLAARYHLDIDLETVSMNIIALEELAREPKNKSLFSVLRDDRRFGLRLLADLLCNAWRKAKAGFYDDGVVRLYRCLELVAQMRLAGVPDYLGGPVNSDNPDWRKIPEEIKERFADIAAEVYRSEKSRGPGTPRQAFPGNLGLASGHMLLFAMGDYIWRKSKLEDLKDFISDVKKRNELMLVHGKKRAKQEDVEVFRGYVEFFLGKLAEEEGVDWKEMLEEHTFVTL